MAGIKNIIFDLGGVFYRIDKGRTISALLKIAGPGKGSQIQRDYDKLSDLPEIAAFERGEVTPVEFRNWLRNSLVCDAGDAELNEAWCGLLMGLEDKMVRMATPLFDQYRVFLLSTNNEIHYEYLLPECRDLFSRFEKTYFSHLTGLRKPEKEAFDQVLNENRLIAEETLFIDDSPGHVRAANSYGFHTIEFANPGSFQQIVGRLLQIGHD